MAKKKATRKKVRLKKEAKAAKPRAGPAKPKAPPEFKEGLPARTTVRTVKLSDIDREDTRFQLRLTATVGDLRKSIQAEGQQVPVILWGEKPPYRIVDGFRRVQAISEIGWDIVKAIVRDDINEGQAFALSFIENVKRKNFSPWDKANAIWQAVNRREMEKEKVAEEFGLSVRQVERYLKLLDLDQGLQEAVQAGKLTMAHAAVLHQSRVKDASPWVTTIESEGLSARQLRRQLKKTGKVGRPRKFVSKEKGGFRVYPFRFTPEMDDREKGQMIEALEMALRIAKGDA